MVSRALENLVGPDIDSIQGNLALSRALGDFEFKKNFNLPPERQIITADPDVTCHEMTEEDEFLVIACDGKSANVVFFDMSIDIHQVFGIA